MKLIIFDLDGTLALSKSSIDDEMASLLRDLMRKFQVAVISGGRWQQFQTQLLAHLKLPTRAVLYCLPCSGAQCYSVSYLQTKRLWNEELSIEEKVRVMNALKTAIDSSGLVFPVITGPQFEDRGAQISWSALGQLAPLELKKLWDPDQVKRRSIVSRLFLGEFDVKIGGTTTIDVTRKGVNKGSGVKKLMGQLGLGEEDVFFVGDAIFPGGNDYEVVHQLPKVSYQQVKGPEETKALIRVLLVDYKPVAS